MRDALDVGLKATKLYTLKWLRLQVAAYGSFATFFLKILCLRPKGNPALKVKVI